VSDDHSEEVERLWQEYSRDFPAAILYLAGDPDDRALKRWLGTLDRLIELGGSSSPTLPRVVPGVASDESGWNLAEMAGMAMIAREANPGIRAETLGELIDLGEQEIRRQVDDDTSGI
jgi:hypothetical protein